jgi:hypothetical protein
MCCLSVGEPGVWREHVFLGDFVSWSILWTRTYAVPWVKRTTKLWTAIYNYKTSLTSHSRFEGVSIFSAQPACITVYHSISQYITVYHSTCRHRLFVTPCQCGGWKAAAFWIAGRSCCDGFNLLPLSRSEDCTSKHASVMVASKSTKIY